MNKEHKVVYSEVKPPKKDCTLKPIVLSDETIVERLNKVLLKMNEVKLDTLVIYADLEHGSNFEYLTGFLPRFEEGLLVLHKDSTAYLLMGNENINKVEHARIKATGIHVPFFSLPNQPMDDEYAIEDYFIKAGIQNSSNVGVVGWKNFTSKNYNNKKLFDVPFYIIDALSKITNNIINSTDLFIGPNGVRTTNNIDEIEYYEFGASLASDCILDAMDALDVGVEEMTLGNILNVYGQRNSVVTIAATGKRFEKAYLYPKNKKIKIGDKISLTVGYRGGLSSRAGYAVKKADEIPENKDYLDVLVKPYFNAIVTWLENIHCNMNANDLYEIIEEVLPKDKYNWYLCPGHLTAEEEWLSSPIYKNSKEKLMSGMLLQTDIIPSLPGYGGTSVESTILLADKQLQKDIREQKPDLWNRFMSRKNYIEKELNINLNEDVLPMCSTLAFLRPYLLLKECAMKVEK